MVASVLQSLSAQHVCTHPQRSLAGLNRAVHLGQVRALHAPGMHLPLRGGGGGGGGVGR